MSFGKQGIHVIVTLLHGRQRALCSMLLRLKVNDFAFCENVTRCPKK